MRRQADHFNAAIRVGGGWYWTVRHKCGAHFGIDEEGPWFRELQIRTGVKLPDSLPGFLASSACRPTCGVEMRGFLQSQTGATTLGTVVVGLVLSQLANVATFLRGDNGIWPSFGRYLCA
jgi:hypothetical protein